MKKTETNLVMFKALFVLSQLKKNQKNIIIIIIIITINIISIVQEITGSRKSFFQ